MRILIIRHAEPDYTTDTLTEKGKIEAELLSQRLIKYDIRDFYVSPLGRARETAKYTLEKLGREAEILPWLEEFRGRYFEEETGKKVLPWDRKPKVWTAFPNITDINKWTESPVYDGCNVAQIWKETTDGVDELLGRYGMKKKGCIWECGDNRPDTIALFCHFGIGIAVLSYLTDISPMLLWHHFGCATSSVTEVMTEERVKGEVAFRTTKVGDITHLEANGVLRSNAGMFPDCYTGVDSTDPYTNYSIQPKP